MSEQTTELTLPARAQAALKTAEIEGKLTLLAKDSAAILAITNPAGFQECHSARMALRNQRLEITRTGEQARKDARDFATAVIAEEKRLVGLIEPEETRLGVIEDAWEAKKEAERQAKVDAERRRIQAIQANLNALRQPALDAAVTNNPDQLAELMGTLDAMPVTVDLFGEFLEDAEQVKVDMKTRLAALHSAAVERQEQDRRNKAEAEELARQRAAQEAAEREARERRDAEEKASQEAIARQEAEAKAKRDAEALEHRERLEAEARAAAEHRQAEEQAALERRQTEEAAATERRRAEDAEIERRRQEAQAEADRLAKEREAAEERTRAAQAKKDAAEKAKRDRAEAKERAAREREEAAERERRQAEMERAEADGMLALFMVRHGKKPEYKDVATAIAEHFGPVVLAATIEAMVQSEQMFSEVKP